MYRRLMCIYLPLFEIQGSAHLSTKYRSSRRIIMANAGLGVPVKLLHESLGHVITVELKTGHLYRGKLAEGMTFFLRLRVRY